MSRVLLLAWDWPAFVDGGIATHAARLADGLTLAGAEVVVATRGGGRRDAALANDRPRPYPVLGVAGRSWADRGMIRWAAALPGLLRTVRPDAVIAHEWRVLGAVAHPPHATAVVAHGRDVLAPAPTARTAAFRAPWSWWTLSEHVATHLRPRVAGPVHVVPPAVDDAAPGVPEPGRVAALGRLVPRKGHATLLEALARLPGASLDIVGDGPERPALQRRAQSGDLAGRVRIHGRLPDPGAVLRAAWVHCLPVVEHAEDVEGFGLAYVEAAAHGVPSVGTAVGGVPEAIGQGGVLLPVGGDPGALAAALGGLLADRATRDRLGAIARDRQRTHLSVAALGRRALAALAR